MKDTLTMDLGKGSYEIDSYITDTIICRFQRFGYRFRINYLSADNKFVVEVRDPVAKAWYGIKCTVKDTEHESYHSLIRLFCD